MWIIWLRRRLSSLVILECNLCNWYSKHFFLLILQNSFFEMLLPDVWKHFFCLRFPEFFFWGMKHFTRPTTFAFLFSKLPFLCDIHPCYKVEKPLHQELELKLFLLWNLSLLGRKHECPQNSFSSQKFNLKNNELRLLPVKNIFVLWWWPMKIL